MKNHFRIEFDEDAVINQNRAIKRKIEIENGDNVSRNRIHKNKKAYQREKFNKNKFEEQY